MASERGVAQTSFLRKAGVVDQHNGFLRGSGTGLESPTEEGNSPVDETSKDQAGTRVPQDTRNPAGSREDHLPRLKTVGDR